MQKKLWGIFAVCIAFFIGGCTLSVTPESDTFVKAENDLTYVTLNLGGTSTTFDRIDLYGVTIGDAYFSSVEGGYATTEKATSLYGPVTVSVDSAVGYQGSDPTYLFTDIPNSSVSVGEGLTTTAYFQGASFLAGATVTPKTMVQVENDLTNLTIDVSGVQTAVSSIELVGITVGDATFADVPGGTTSAAKTTFFTGTVAVTIDSAYVIVPGFPVALGFAVNAQLSTTIDPDITNTVIFDETSAGAIINSLAKKKAP